MNAPGSTSAITNSLAKVPGMSSSAHSIRSRFPAMGTNIFTTMNLIAEEHKAVNLAQGFPSFDSPPELVDFVTEALRSGKNQYAPMPGLPQLREAISEKVAFLYGRTYDPATEITVTPGGHTALTSAALSVLHPGDEAIIFDPSFDCFAPIVTLCGATPVIVNLTFPEYSIPWDEVALRITPRTRLIWINTPHNPTGSILGAADMARLTELTRGTEIVVLSDEVYEHMTFDGLHHESVCKYPELAERSLSVYSFGKVYHATGWKIGYCLAPKPLMAEFRKIHQMITFTSNHPIQWGLAQFLKRREHYLDLPRFYQEKRDFFLAGLEGSRFGVLPAKGSYFQCLTYRAISDEPEMVFAKRLAQEAKVAAIPVSAFYKDGTDNKVLRFCFAKSDEILERATSALKTFSGL
jgi:methionine aminotransferase